MSVLPRSSQSELVRCWAELRARVEQLRPGAHLLAVSKGQPFAKIAELYQAGQRDFGENYVQELLLKRDAAKAAGMEEIRWHLIGQLQRKKIPKLVPWLSGLQTLERVEVAEALEARWEAPRPLEVYIEVNWDRVREPQKGGIDPGQVATFLAGSRFWKRIRVVGLMVIPPPGAVDVFDRMRELRDALDPTLRLSMGMSDDFEAALRAGSDVVRIGTRLFGPRVL